MTKLDSLFYRWAFSVRKKVLPLFGVPMKRLPPPIIYGDSKLSPPRPDLLQKLTVKEREKLTEILPELELFSRLHNRFPLHPLTETQWRELLLYETMKERLDFLKFIRQNELNDIKDERRKSMKQSTKEILEENSPNVAMTHAFFNPHPEEINRWTQQRDSLRFIRSCQFKETPQIAIDCRFLPFLTKRAQNLTSLQLAHLIAENRKSGAPWPLHFVNFFDELSAFKSARKKHLGTLESSRNVGAFVTERNYTDIFERKNIVYLSPDAEEPMQQVDPDAVYVIGAIVDRVAEKGIPKHASFEASQVDQVKAMRLPLDEFVDWKSGTKFLTLVTVMRILQLTHANGGDWRATFDKLIPVRYVKGAEEKHAPSRELHESIREYDRQVLQLVERRLGRPAKRAVVPAHM